MKIINISESNLDQLDQFVSSLADSANSFRYFSSRPLSIITSHLCTKLLLDDDNKPVGYGHLDPEQNKVWLGIALLPEYKGKGLGKLIMQDLIESAKNMKLQNLNLSVDNSNQSAIALYEKVGFQLIEKKEKIAFYRLPLSNCD